MPESSDKTRVIYVDHDRPSPTVMAYGLENCRFSQVYIVGKDMPKPTKKHSRADEGGARRLTVSAAYPAPTIMAGGIGSVNTGQYRIETVGEPPMTVGPAKPPYRVPSMAEITAIPWNGFTVASTFSGCGGSSLGYRMAGFKVLWASEFIDAARESYLANCSKDTVVDGRDIREVSPADVLKTMKLKAGQLDLLDGSPPCASFSTAGKREQHWGQVKKYSDKEQRTDDLFFEFIRLIEGIRPKTFVAENVSGLVKGTAKGYFIEILKKMKSVGYRVSVRVLDAQWLGVPQCRQRAIFIGVRDDLKIDPVHPSPLPYRYSVREAIPWIGGGTIDQGKVYDEDNRSTSTDEPCPTVKSVGIGAQLAGKVSIVHRQGSAGIPKGGKPVSADRPLPTVCGTQAQQELLSRADSDVPVAGRKKVFQGDNASFGKEGWQDVELHPSSTIGASPQTGNGRSPPSELKTVDRVTGAVERRKFSIAELKRICAFPDDFVLTGSYAQQWERLGRAVPPVMMFHVAKTVRDSVLRKVKK